jgi:hypothetical protein
VNIFLKFLLAFDNMVKQTGIKHRKRQTGSTGSTHSQQDKPKAIKGKQQEERRQATGRNRRDNWKLDILSNKAARK